MVNARFMDEVILLCEPIRDGDLTEIEKESTHIAVQLTSLRAFRSSLKHRVVALSGGADVEMVGRGSGEDD